MTDRITLTDGMDTVHLLPGIEFTITPMEVAHTAVMASGREVRDYIGYRYALYIPTGWLSSGDLARLNRMIRTAHELDVTYPSPEGDMVSRFYFTMPALTAFRYDESGTAWYGVVLNGSGTEVFTE